jgi:hypothetical protein
MNTEETIDQEIDNIIKESKKFRFQLELSQTTDADKKLLLNQIIDSLDKKNNENNSDTSKNILQKFSDKVYSQSWSKLKSIHKEDRLKKFVNEKHNNNEKLLKFLIEHLENGHFNKKNTINYDSISASIVSIPNLQESSKDNFSFSKSKKT